MDSEIIFISKSRTYQIQSKKTRKKIKDSHKNRLRNYYLSYGKKKSLRILRIISWFSPQK